jgi:hypothetical protein
MRGSSQLGRLSGFLVPNISAGGGQMVENGWKANPETDIFGTTRAIEAAMSSLHWADSDRPTNYLP